MKKYFLRICLLASLFISSILLSSCASYQIKKDCEATNWHQYGFDLAMKGQRVSGDNKVEQCRKVERISDSQLDVGFKTGMDNYCKPEIVYSTGRNGDFFNMDMCDPGAMGTLRAKHAQGVREYCAAGNGFAAGAKGRPYNNVCPKEMEKAFLKEFQRGRQKYLIAMVAENKSRIADLDRNQMTLERERLTLSYQLNSMPQPKQVEERRYNEVTKQIDVQQRFEDPYQFQRSQVQNQISQKDLALAQARKQQETLKNQTHEFERELATFDVK